MLFVVSAPSGAGKTSVVKELLNFFPELVFSVSATTRKIREGEIEGNDYYYLSEKEFLSLIENGELVEYEHIYGDYYGTLKAKVDESLDGGKHMIFDIDVKGALSVKNIYKENCVLIYIEPPDIEELKARLIKRGTESEQELKKRFERFDFEMAKKEDFDYVIMNDDLKKAVEKAKEIIKKYI